MTETAESNGQMLLMLGELRGQVRELVHTVNNTAQLINGITDRVNASQGLPDAIKALELKIAAHEVRLTAIEATENQRKGAITLGAVLIRCIPWMAGGVTFAGIAKLLGGLG